MSSDNKSGDDFYCDECFYNIDNCMCGPYCGTCQGSCVHDDDSFYGVPSDYVVPRCETHKPSGKFNRDCNACEQLAADEEKLEKAKAIECSRREKKAAQK